MILWKKPTEVELLQRELETWKRHELDCKLKLIEAEHKIRGLIACLNYLKLEGEDHGTTDKEQAE